MTNPADGTAPTRGRTAIVAGGGSLPLEVARALTAAGEAPFIAIVEGEVDTGSALYDLEHETIALEDVARLAPLLKRAGAERVVLAGGIGRRPDWRRLKPSLPLLAIAGRVVAGLARGDNALLSALVGHLEAAGMRVVGAHDIVPDLLAPRGVLTRRRPTKAELLTCGAAFRAAKALGALDIGQGAIAVGGRVIAVEGVEGTDGLLERVAGYRGRGRLAGAAGGVLAKCVKPGQEARADLPTIGPQTADGAHGAGLGGIAVEAGWTLILQQRALIERADALGLFVIGVIEGELP